MTRVTNLETEGVRSRLPAIGKVEGEDAIGERAEERIGASVVGDGSVRDPSSVNGPGPRSRGREGT